MGTALGRRLPPSDDRVCAFEADGKHLWDAPIGGFVFGVAPGDLRPLENSGPIRVRQTFLSATRRP